MPFGAQNKNICTASQTLLTEVELPLRRKLWEYIRTIIKETARFNNVRDTQPHSQSASAISDVTCQACRENSLGSKPPLVTRIARTGLYEVA